MLTQSKTILRDLGDGLVMRRATPEDADALATFNRVIHSDNEQDGQCLADWTRDLLTAHPTFHPDDFTVIEEICHGTNRLHLEFDLTDLVIRGDRIRSGPPRACRHPA